METTGERHIIEVFDEGMNIHAWSYWKRNYISVQHGMHKGRLDEKFAEHYKTVVLYIREVDAKALAGPFSISDIPYNTHSKQPRDMRRVGFEDSQDRLYRPNDGQDYLCFDYSPSGGYPVPPESVLETRTSMPLSALLEYEKYYADAGGVLDLRYAEFPSPVGTLRLHDLRHRGIGRNGRWDMQELWGISRGERGSQEVWGVNETWIPEGSSNKRDEICMTFVNEYPEWGWSWKKAIKWLEHFAQADSSKE